LIVAALPLVEPLTAGNLVASYRHEKQTVLRITLPAMQPHIVRPYLNSNAQIRRLRISRPLIGCLVDGTRHMLPNTMPPPTSDDLRP